MNIAVELLNPEQRILEEIANPRMTRDDVAYTYAFMLRQGGDYDYARVNKAIIDRWSRSALEYIKKKAWRLLV